MFDFSAVALIIFLIGSWWALLVYVGIHLIKLMSLVTSQGSK